MCVSALLEFNQAVLVSRKDPESRRKAVAQVRERLTSDGYWPQVRVVRSRLVLAAVCCSWHLLK